ncbi:BA14K family protein [Rhizobium sp. ARZ01]|nr:BA14K family protein [Rhizobium sp. ARZ01]MBD9372713.1 BA14K family protein [Rhizobium sp. ARZ01]
MKMFAVIGLSLATALSSAAPVEAFPYLLSQRLQVSDVQQVKEHRRSRGWSRNYSGRNWRRYAGNRRYNNGYRYNRYRYGHNRRYYNNYNDYDDFGLVIGGLAAGAIIGGLLTQPYYGGYYGPSYYGPSYYGRSYYGQGYYAPRYYGGYYGATGHSSWCYARYRSYRAYDNTFQPYYGPRRQCISPYR